jgi:hypothetical protein
MTRGILVKYRIHKKIYSLYLLMVLIIFCTGCDYGIAPIFPTSIEGPASGTILIEDGAESTYDRTPPLTVYSEGAAYMSFSGDGVNWSEWIQYSPAYEDFNIANNLNGTQFSSGLKYIYVRFKDENEKLSLSDNIAYNTINYEFKKLNSIKIFPSEITMTVGSSYIFEVKGYDIDSNEVPLDGSKVNWVKCCGVGSLSNTSGFTTAYTAPTVAGERDVVVEYGPLRAGAKIVVVNE